MAGKVRVRYAPSPTGEPHVGNIRTAFFNWLFARHSGGSFIVRIEDTDQTRKVEGAVETILEALRWLELDWDEGPHVGGPFGPYFQSQRLDKYHQVAQGLLEQGYAYRCYCSPQRLEEMRRQQQREKRPPGYDRHCRDLSDKERAAKEAQGVTPVVRFKMPLEGETSIDDLIRGHVSFQNRLLDDFVILKSDGFPTYHLANVVDDHLMEITHVMRAEEWLSSAPRHIQLYGALGWDYPLFAHLPMILGPDHSKLSKRHGATSMLEYRDMGFLPQAMCNFLALLGWSLDDQTEIIPRNDLVAHFSLERIGKAGAIFSQDKLTWMNGYYIRQLAAGDLAERIIGYWNREGGRLWPQEVPRPLDKEYLRGIVPLAQERMKTLADAADLTGYFFAERLQYDASLLIQKGMDQEETRKSLEIALERLEQLTSFEAGTLEGLLRPLAQELNLKTGQLFGALRVATTGRTAAPPLFQTMEVLGRERCLTRIRDALEKMGPQIS